MCDRTFWTVTMKAILAGSLAVVLSGCDDRAAEIRETDPAETQGSESVNKGGTELDMSDKYDLRVTPARIPTGKTSKVSVYLEPTGSLKVNKEYPWSLSLASEESLSISETEFDKKSLRLKKDRAVAQTFIRAREAGDYEVKMNADFSVCDKDRCYRISEDQLSLRLGASRKSKK